MVRGRGPDHAAADDHDAGAVGQIALRRCRFHGRPSLAGLGSVCPRHVGQEALEVGPAEGRLGPLVLLEPPLPEVEIERARRRPGWRPTASSRTATSGPTGGRAPGGSGTRAPSYASTSSASCSSDRWHSLQMLPSSKYGIVVARVLVVDDRHAAAVVNEVGGQQVVVARPQRHGPEREGRRGSARRSRHGRGSRPGGESPDAGRGPGTSGWSSNMSKRFTNAGPACSRRQASATRGRMPGACRCSSLSVSPLEEADDEDAVVGEELDDGRADAGCRGPDAVLVLGTAVDGQLVGGRGRRVPHDERRRPASTPCSSCWSGRPAGARPCTAVPRSTAIRSSSAGSSPAPSPALTGTRTGAPLRGATMRGSPAGRRSSAWVP